MPGSAHKSDRNRQPSPEDFSSIVLKEVNLRWQAEYEMEELSFYNHCPAVGLEQNKMKTPKRITLRILINALKIYTS